MPQKCYQAYLAYLAYLEKKQNKQKRQVEVRAKEENDEQTNQEPTIHLPELNDNDGIGDGRPLPKKNEKAARNLRFKEALISHFESIYEPGDLYDEIPVSQVENDYRQFVAGLDLEQHPAPWRMMNHVTPILKEVAPRLEKRKSGTIASGNRSSPAFYIFIRRK